MFFGLLRRRFSQRFAVVSFVLAVLMASELEGLPEVVRVIRGTTLDVVRVGRSILARLFGEDTILSVEKLNAQVLGGVAGWVADNLNAILQLISQFLQATGVQAGLPINKVSPERLVPIAQWLTKVLIYNYFIFEFFHLARAMFRLGIVLLVWLVPDPRKVIKKKMNNILKRKSVK